MISINNQESPEYYRRELANFAYKISHDLQTPLRSVIGFSNLVLASAGNKFTVQEKEDMQMVLGSARHAQELIEALLQYSRLISIPHVPVKIESEAVLREVLEAMDEKIVGTSAHISYNSLPDVLADPRQLYRLFYYLLCNAIKFHQPDHSPIIRITAEPYEKKDYWLFRVIDNGIGIDSKYHNVVFDLFRKLHSDEEYPGLGAGLAFARKIVEQHHGTIGLDSFPGQGTSVWFTLPAALEGEGEVQQ